MTKTIRYLAKFRDWRSIAIAGIAGFCLTFAALAASVSLSGRAILAAAAIGSLSCVGLTFLWCALCVIRKLSEQNVRRNFALNNMAQGLCMFDGQHRLVVWNKNYEVMYGLESTIRRGCGKSLARC